MKLIGNVIAVLIMVIITNAWKLETAIGQQFSFLIFELVLYIKIKTYIHSSNRNPKHPPLP